MLFAYKGSSPADVDEEHTLKGQGWQQGVQGSDREGGCLDAQ